jgi:hypothetical protein
MASRINDNDPRSVARSARNTKNTKPQSLTVRPPAANDPILQPNRDTYNVVYPGTDVPFVSGTGGGGGAGGGVQPAAMSDDDWLAGDSAYQAQLAALMKALSDSQADFTGQRTRYDTDYNDALRSLGWTNEIADDPNTPDVDESRPGAWNFQDLNTASGRAFTNQQNDFASRGLLQSSLFGTALDNLQRSLNDQLGSINTGRTNFLDDLTRQETAAKNENTLGQQQARAEALARRAAGLSIV